MAPKLSVSAGPDINTLQPVHVNDEAKPTNVSNDLFEGRILIRIKDFNGDTSSSPTDTHYFDHSYAKGCTWSLAIQGRFKKDVDVDDVEFGNLFDKPIRDRLPWGTSAALHAISYLDPNLTHDVYADKPWAMSPLICTMSRVHVQRFADSVSSAQEGEEDKKGWPDMPHGTDDYDYVVEDTSALLCTRGKDDELDTTLEKEGFADRGTLSQLKSSHDIYQAPKFRVRFWGNQGVRQATSFTPQDIVTMDFCHGLIRFSDLHLSLAGMSFDLTAYHDGQPVRFVARNKRTEEVYFVVEFQIAAKDA